MKATITIEMNGAAFDDEDKGAGELARILRAIATITDPEEGGSIDFHYYPLKDINGNTVGGFQIKDD